MDVVVTVPKPLWKPWLEAGDLPGEPASGRGNSEVLPCPACTGRDEARQEVAKEVLGSITDRILGVPANSRSERELCYLADWIRARYKIERAAGEGEP